MSNMKKSHLLRILGAAIAMGAAIPTIPSAPVASTEQTATQSKEQITQRVKSGSRIIQEAGGLQVYGIGNTGIPPHIYGQYYVRRGTHKRTNKRG